jgi:hypothetical protein
MSSHADIKSGMFSTSIYWDVWILNIDALQHLELHVIVIMHPLSYLSLPANFSKFSKLLTGVSVRIVPAAFQEITVTPRSVCGFRGFLKASQRRKV